MENTDVRRPIKKRRMPYHRRYHVDTLQSDSHLSLDQRGALWTIQSLIYDAGGPIKRDERWLSNHLNCSIRKARALISKLIELDKLFIDEQGQISNRRCEIELEISRDISQKAAEAAAVRERQKAEESKLALNEPLSTNEQSAALPVSTAIELPTRGGERFAITVADVAEWSKSCPDVNILQELVFIKAWLNAGPNRLKAKGDVRRSVVSWLIDAQRKISRPGHASPKQARADQIMQAVSTAFNQPGEIEKPAATQQFRPQNSTYKTKFMLAMEAKAIEEQARSSAGTFAYLDQSEGIPPPKTLTLEAAVDEYPSAGG